MFGKQLGEAVASARVSTSDASSAKKASGGERRSALFIAALLPLPLVLVACFGSVTVVPAAQAPKIQSGSGWFCYEAIRPDRVTPNRSVHETRCARANDVCTRSADSVRRQEPKTSVTTCGPRPKAACTATFTDASNPSWDCYASVEECSPKVGGMAGVPGTKQSECAEYE